MAEERPLGPKVDWSPAPRPGRTPMRGTHVLLRPVEPGRDAEPLHTASNEAIWTYLPDGPYADAEALRGGLEPAARSEDPLFFTICALPEERPMGVCSYLRIEPAHGVIEIGHIWFGLPLQRTPGATEAIYLLGARAFDELGYRRLEWKCNALNAPSRRAAERFGFTFEGVFRQHMVVKGRNRDTAWYAITDEEWPAIRSAFEDWLDPANFDEKGRQRRRLEELR